MCSCPRRRYICSRRLDSREIPIRAISDWATGRIVRSTKKGAWVCMHWGRPNLVRGVPVWGSPSAFSTPIDLGRRPISRHAKTSQPPAPRHKTSPKRTLAPSRIRSALNRSKQPAARRGARCRWWWTARDVPFYNTLHPMGSCPPDRRPVPRSSWPHAVMLPLLTVATRGGRRPHRCEHAEHDIPMHSRMLTCCGVPTAPEAERGSSVHTVAPCASFVIPTVPRARAVTLQSVWILL